MGFALGWREVNVYQKDIWDDYFHSLDSELARLQRLRPSIIPLDADDYRLYDTRVASKVRRGIIIICVFAAIINYASQ
mgnify:CR=1 FL=1